MVAVNTKKSKFPVYCYCIITTNTKVVFSESCILKKSFNFIFSTFILFFLGQRETERELARKRERGRQNLKQAPGSKLTAESLMWGSNSLTARSCHDLS